MTAPDDADTLRTELDRTRAELAALQRRYDDLNAAAVDAVLTWNAIEEEQAHPFRHTADRSWAVHPAVVALILYAVLVTAALLRSIP